MVLAHVDHRPVRLDLEFHVGVSVELEVEVHDCD